MPRVACGDDEQTVVTGVDGGTCSFGQTYTVDWMGSYPRAHNLVTFRPTREYTLDVRASDGGVAESCSMTLPCEPSVADIAARLTDPSVVPLLSFDGGVLGASGSVVSDVAPRTIWRADGKRIVVGACTSTACTDYPLAIRELFPIFSELNAQYKTTWDTCAGWPKR